MKSKYPFVLLATGLLALASCGGEASSSSLPREDASSSTESSERDPDLEAKEAIAALLAELPGTSFKVAWDGGSFVKDPSYISYGDRGYILLEGYALYDSIAYPYAITDGEVDVLIAELDGEGTVAQSIGDPTLEGFVDLTYEAISSVDGDGCGIISDAENPVHAYFALGEEATGDLRVALTKIGIALAYEGGFSAEVSEIGTASEPVIATYLEEVGLPMGGIAPNYAMNLVYANSYNSVTSFYPIVDGVVSEEPEKVTMLDQSSTVIHLYSEDDPIGLILAMAREGEGTEQVDVALDEDGNVTAVTYSDYIVDGEIVPWKEAGLTADLFDISGFRLGYEIPTSLDGSTYEQYYQYYGWKAEDCYFSSVREALPEGQRIVDFEIVLPHDSIPANDRISQIRYETADGSGNPGYLIVTEVDSSPSNPEIPEIG